MTRRIVQVNSAPDLPAFDEPMLPLGPLYLSLRRTAYLAAALALAGLLVRLLGAPALAVLPYGFPVTPGTILATLTAGPLLALAFQEPRALTPEAQLWLALRGARGRRRGGEGGGEAVEEYVVQADPDLGVAEVEVVGVAVDPATGRPLDYVVVEVDGVKHEVGADGRGGYRLALELPRGVHRIAVVLPGSRVVLRSMVVRVL